MSNPPGSGQYGRPVVDYGLAYLQQPPQGHYEEDDDHVPGFVPPLVQVRPHYVLLSICAATLSASHGLGKNKALDELKHGSNACVCVFTATKTSSSNDFG